MDAETLIYNWSGLSNRLLSFLLSGDLFDIELQVGARVFGAHKLILCASSDVFKTMLTNRKWSEAYKETVELVEEPDCESVFGKFISYLYSGEVYLSRSNVGPMLVLADKYNVKDLIPICHKYMLDNLDATEQSFVLQWWQLTSLHGNTDTENKILNFIKWNFSHVMQTPDFLTTSANAIETILESSNLVVQSERSIFVAVLTWLEQHIIRNHPPEMVLKLLFQKLTSLIRWSMFSKEDFTTLDSCDKSQYFIDKYKDYFSVPQSNFFAENLSARKLFGNKTVHHYSESSTGRIERLELSRVYTNDLWCTELNVTDFSNFPRYSTQTFFFSTPAFGLSQDDNQGLDWEVVLYPKGVCFSQALLIQSGGTISMIDESFKEVVRLSIISRSPAYFPLKVEVNVLKIQSTNKNTRVENCYRRTCIFDNDCQLHNLDDVVPFDLVSAYLTPSRLHSNLHLAPTCTFSLPLIIRPLPS